MTVEVKIYYWEPTGAKGWATYLGAAAFGTSTLHAGQEQSVGHVSIEVDSEYFGAWPLENGGHAQSLYDDESNNKMNRNHDDELTFEADDHVGELMKSKIRSLHNARNNYNVRSNSCVHGVASILQAGGVELRATAEPSAYFSRLKETEQNIKYMLERGTGLNLDPATKRDRDQSGLYHRPFPF